MGVDIQGKSAVSTPAAGDARPFSGGNRRRELPRGCASGEAALCLFQVLEPGAQTTLHITTNAAIGTVQAVSLNSGQRHQFTVSFSICWYSQDCISKLF